MAKRAHPKLYFAHWKTTKARAGTYVGRVFTREPETVIDGPLSRSRSGAGRMAQNKGARVGTGACWGDCRRTLCAWRRVANKTVRGNVGLSLSTSGRRSKYILFDNMLL